MVPVDAHNVVAIAGPEMFKTTVLKRVIQVKALVVRLVVSVPVIVVHMLGVFILPLGRCSGSGLACDSRCGGGAGTCP